MYMLNSKGGGVEPCGKPFLKERGRLVRPSLVGSVNCLLEIS